MFESVFWCLVTFIGYMMVYILVDRICKCCETCSMNKAMGACLGKDILKKDDKNK